MLVRHCASCTCWVDSCITAQTLTWRMVSYRTKYRLTMRQAAARLGVQLEIWRRWENGSVKPRNTETKLKLQTLLSPEDK